MKDKKKNKTMWQKDDDDNNRKERAVKEGEEIDMKDYGNEDWQVLLGGLLQ